MKLLVCAIALLGLLAASPTPVTAGCSDEADLVGTVIQCEAASATAASGTCDLVTWFENTPWLGFTLDTPFFQEYREGLEDEDDADPITLTGLLMLRYPKGRLQPYLGIGAGLFVGDDNAEVASLLNHFVVGLSYSF